MATLKDLFSAQQIAELKSVAVDNTCKQACTHIDDEAWERVYDLATELGHEINKYFWECLDLNIAHSESGGVIVAMKGKHQHEFLTVCYEVWWAKHLGQMLKEGWRLLWLSDFGVEEITWNNWKRVYSMLTHRPDTRQYERQLSRSEALDILENRRRDGLFYDLAKPIRMKKGQRAVSLEEANLQRVRSERAGKKSKTIFRAKQILSVI